jgi:hypothetical protein
VLGCLLLAAVARAGAITGAPTMVLLRGLLGRTGSYAPTVLNLLQCVGWATYEVWVISFAAHAVWSGLPALGVRADRRRGRDRDGAAAARLGAAAQADRGRRRAGQLGVLPGRDAAPAAGRVRRGRLDRLLDLDGPGRRAAGVVDPAGRGLLPVLPLAAGGRARHRIGYALSSAVFFLLGVLALRAYAGRDQDVVGALLAVPPARSRW